MNVEVSVLAQQELDEAFEWYEMQRFDLGYEFLVEFHSAIKRVVTYPKAQPVVEDDLRKCLLTRFPYSIVYGIDGDKIIIIAVAHQHRKLNYWLDRLYEK